MCTGGKKFSDFQVDCLDAHNEFRSRHGVPNLDLNLKLCKYAEDHAKYLCQCGAEKSSKGPFGENIYIKESQRKIVADAQQPVMEWYQEIDNFDENKCYPSKNTKHFAQVVWKETRSLGVGFAINHQKNIVYVVANYYPAGNVFATFAENIKPVRKPKSDCPSKVKVI